MLARIFAAAVVFAALAACERPQEPVATEVAPRASRLAEPRKVSTAPEHFDRRRTEQYENEEDRLRRRGRAN